MALISITSPHAHNSNATERVMLMVAAACIPGILALVIAFGWGVLSNIIIATLCALIFEASALKARGIPALPHLKDYSALVTAIILGIAVPPYSAWWLIAVGMFFSIVVAKQLYGGLGFNPFNPAMVGYVVLLISFPVEMTRWAAPLASITNVDVPSLFEAFSISLGFSTHPVVDGLTSATPLDIVRQNSGSTFEEISQSSSVFGIWAGLGWEWSNLAFLAGGLFLLYKRIYTWHAPVSMLLTLAIISALFHDSGSSSSIGSAQFQLLSGATMFGAWFILTDPVSSATSNKGRIVFGVGAGILIYIIRRWGNYPDAIAFAVLLMNFAAPLIDHYTQPKTYGH